MTIPLKTVAGIPNRFLVQSEDEQNTADWREDGAGLPRHFGHTKDRLQSGHAILLEQQHGPAVDVFVRLQG